MKEETKNIEKEKDKAEEEEMVVADMSLVRGRSVFLPERIRHEGRLKQSGSSGKTRESAGGFESPIGEELSPEATKWAILGSLKAALLIGGAYAIGLWLLVLVMFVLFKYFA